MRTKPLLIFVLLASLSCAKSPSTFPDANLIIIGLDTFRADHVGMRDDGGSYTPRIDEFASQAVTFENAYSTSSWTLPSFASLFTGLLPSEHGAVGGPFILEPNKTTLAEILRHNGYKTAGYVGVDWLSPEFGMDQGFEQQQRFVEGAVSTRFEQYQSLVTEYLASPTGEPFFLFAHIYDAHAPYRPPAPFDRMYYQPGTNSEETDELEFLFTEPNRTQTDSATLYHWLRGAKDPAFPVAQYAAGVSYVDQEVGSLIDALRQSGQLDKSIVVIVGDHGEHLTEHDIYFTHLFPYQETLHVPLMIRLPGEKWAGREILGGVSLIDVMPTLLELLGLDSPPVSGISQLESMRYSGAESLQRRWLFAESGGPDRERAVWNDRYRLLRFKSPQAGLSYELYDRKRDPRETINVAEERPELLSNLVDVLEQRFQGSEELGSRSRSHGLSEEAEARLKALGYL